MSQLESVLRRSILHLPPSDSEGRDRVFASAREAMIRLLRVYDPPLTSYEIDSKIQEFDAIVDAIDGEFHWARPLAQPALLAIGGPEPRARMALPTRAALPAPAELEPPATEPEAGLDDEDDYEDFEDLEELEADAGDPYDEVEPYDFEDGYGPFNRFLDFIDTIGWRVIAAAGVAVLLLGGIGIAMVLHGRQPAPIIAAQSEPGTPPPAAETPQPQPAPAAAPVARAPAAAPVAPAAGGLALESLVLFDGRDPSVFQSAPENPVSFQGDADGGFARVSSSTGATGARIEVGRGVYARIAGHQIRIVLVVRAARTAPATGLRFAYQNGRMQSPWTDMPVGPTYTPISAVWTAPPERGGPENDSLIIEPGVPGDGTAVDIRSARIEILN